MAGNLELGRATKASQKAGTLQNVRSRKGAGNGNNIHAAAAGVVKGKAAYPNVPRNAETIKGSRARGKTLDTRLDPPLFQP